MKLLAGTSEGVFALGDRGSAVSTLKVGRVRDLRETAGACLAGTRSGVYRSEDGGQSWELAGATGRAVWQFAVRADNGSEVFAVTQPPGLFHSEDGGKTWEEIRSFTSVPGAERWCLPVTPPEPARARAIALDRDDPQQWWVGVEVGAVARTTDGGKTWTAVTPGGNPDIHVLALHPATPGVLFASTGFGRLDGVAEMTAGNAGVFRSDDQGATWQYLWRGMTPLYTRPMCIDPRPPHGLTVACAPTADASHEDDGGAGAMLYRTDDLGRTWRSLCDIDHSPSAANFHALIPAPDAAGAVLVGTDTGEVWHVSEDAKWMLVAKGLASVLSVLPLSAS